MPCNQIRRTTVALENANPVLLLAALGKLGYGYMDQVLSERESRAALASVYDGHTLTLTGNLTVNEVKRAYSQEVVQSAAQKYGWRVKSTGSNKYTATRRA